MKMSTDLRLPSVLVLCQIDPGDGAKWSKELLQVCLTGVLRQIGHTNSGIVISCRVQTYSVYTDQCSCSSTVTQVKNGCTATKYNNLNPPLRLGCMDSPLRVPPSLKLGGTYFPVLLCAGCAGSGSAGERETKAGINLSTVNHRVLTVDNEKLIKIWWSHWRADGTRASRLLLVCCGKPKLFSQLLLHGT